MMKSEGGRSMGYRRRASCGPDFRVDIRFFRFFALNNEQGLDFGAQIFRDTV